jgi:aryl-alcohol dehydrogenase-like predicted oxidoreductase
MESFESTTLGHTGIKVGRLGVAASYGAPTEAFEEAFERGCNYFYWGSQRRSGMRQAILNICQNGNRDDLIIVVQSYSRSALLMETFLKRALRSLAIDYADVLLLGWHNKQPASRLLDKAITMREKGLCRFVGLSGHNRSLFPLLAEQGVFDIFHIRYNAAHRGPENEIFPELLYEARPAVVSYTATRWGQLLNPKKMPPGEQPMRASDCYRFALSNPAGDVCMCGPRDTAQMREALRSLDLGPLDDNELKRVLKIGDYVHAHSGKFF